MQTVDSWPVPEVPILRGGSPVSLYDAASGQLQRVHPPSGEALLYVCGITPYDATHLGHAATYLAFDTLVRAWRAAGLRVRSAQNITDVDDPLLERARQTGRDWQEIAHEQTRLFREDMTALRVLPPESYVRVQDVMAEITAGIERLRADGIAYPLPVPAGEQHTLVEPGAQDVYFDVSAAERQAPWSLGSAARTPTEQMNRLFREFGGDPERSGKRDPLDPLLWRAARKGEPAWPGPSGTRGRPGWHVECAIIATNALGPTLTVQGGGRDLRFPHHDMSAAHAAAMTGKPFALGFAHAGLIAYEGKKMSKSLGNLVLVSRLREAGADPAAIRLAVLAHHYREDWEWRDEDLAHATARLKRWRQAASAPASPASGEAGRSETVRRMLTAIATDLDTPAVIAAVDEWAGTAGEEAAGDVPESVDALLGVQLR